MDNCFSDLTPRIAEDPKNEETQKAVMAKDADFAVHVRQCNKTSMQNLSTGGVIVSSIYTCVYRDSANSNIREVSVVKWRFIG
jgi:hypothetical protein